jgi:hypothetical protein
MKKLFLSIIFAAIAAIGFGQVAFTEVAFDSLDVASKKLFSKYGVANPYGNVVKIKADSVTGIYKITGIKKSRKMIADSSGVKTPETPDQYMTIYMKNGKTMAFVSLDDPRVNGSDAATIAALMSGTGLKQGDDEFPDAPTTTPAPSYTISKEW